VWSLSSDWRQRDGVSELLETTDVVTFDARGIESIEVIDAEFSVWLASLQDVVNGNKNAVRDGSSSLVAATSPWRRWN
jgi:hypothetical protein